MSMDSKIHQAYNLISSNIILHPLALTFLHLLIRCPLVKALPKRCQSLTVLHLFSPDPSRTWSLSSFFLAVKEENNLRNKH